MPRRLILILVLVLASCATPQGGGEPILERPAELRHACAMAGPLVDYTPIGWSGASLAVQADGTFLLARFEGDGVAPPRLIVSALTASGTEPGLTIPTGTGSISATALSTSPEGWALVWGEGNEVRFARQDGAGATAPVVVASASGTIDAVHLAPLGEGLGVMWQSRAQDQPQDLRFARIDTQGVLQREAHLLARTEGPYYFLSASLAAREGGLAAIFGDAPARRLAVVTIDPSGMPSAPRELPLPAAPAGFQLTESDAFLAATPSGYLAAWSEASFNGDFGMPMGHTVIRLLPLAPDATPIGEPLLLSRPENDVDEIQPRLVRIHDSIAVIWARGTRIYVCGGCMPDHRLRMVLLDPERLVPASNLLADIGAGAPSGLVGHQVAVSGSDVALAFSVAYHVSSEPGTTLLRCEPAP
ncbi:MAG: hypothetical protein K8H88_01115 [Sandaracinaceae bacterium]|nr:hypothetical protein [Sandaracinaceae bacterium]